MRPLVERSKLDQLVDKKGLAWTPPAALHFDHPLGWRGIYADDFAVVHVRRCRKHERVPA